MVSHGPSPTPTMTMERGKFAASTMAFTVSCSKEESWPSGVEVGRVTWPSATMMRTWYCPPDWDVISHALRMMGAKVVGPACAGEDST